jgi:Zn-dependent M32 family carboxypeptidase
VIPRVAAPSAAINARLDPRAVLGFVERARLSSSGRHPCCAKFSAEDVRITTRVDEKHFGDALFPTMHEAGHALYEQSVAAALEGTPLGSGTSWGGRSQ